MSWFQNNSAPAGPAFVFGAPDNLIAHGVAFANWTVDAGSSKSAAGIVLTQTGTSDQAIYDVTASVSTEYWMCVVTDSASGGYTGNVRLVALADTGCEVAGTTGALVNFGSAGALGTFYMRVKTGATQATGGKSRIVLKHATSPDTNWVRITGVTLFPIPTRSAAKICILGDRESGFVSGTATAVDTAILAAAQGGDAVNCVCPGDLTDGTPTLASNNDSIRNTLIGRGGNLYAAPGNWDYTGGIATWETYFGLSAGQSNRYRSVVLGECQFFFYDSNPENTDNNQVNVAGAKADVMGQWLLAAIAASTAKWKIPVIHHPMYSSSTHHGGPSNGGGWSDAFKSMQWDWATLGVPFVLNSHDHVVEAMLVSNTLHLTFALGGGGANAFGTPIAESIYRSLVSGLVKIYDSPTALVLEVLDTAVPPALLWRYKITQ